MQSVRHRDPDMASARAVRLGPRDFTIERKNDGTIYMRSPHRLDPYPDKLTERLEHWAARTPDMVFLAGRGEGAERTTSYAGTLARLRRIGAAPLTRALSAQRPFRTLSGH